MLDTVKDKPVGQVFGGSFSWDAQLDALADIYLAVGHQSTHMAALTSIVRILVKPHRSRYYHLVLSALVHGYLRV